MTVFVSAPWRSSGKTIVSLALARAALNAGHQVQTYKKGPDYIDPRWLQLGSGRACYNLDLNVQSRSEIQRLFNAMRQPADMALVEGTMGLHDGLADDGSDSNAAIAGMLGTEVVLVVDGRGMNRTVAALLDGLQRFDTRLVFAGVLFNRVRSTRHASKLRKAVEQHTDLRVLGELPESASLNLPEQELGLTPVADMPAADALVQAAADLLRENCELDVLFMAMRSESGTNTTEAPAAVAKPLDNLLAVTDRPFSDSPLSGPVAANLANASCTEPESPDATSPGDELPAERTFSPVSVESASSAHNTRSTSMPLSSSYAGLNIGLAHDQAFHFYYADDLDRLRALGVRLVETSPIHDAMPADLDGFIIGGGFPERHAAALSANDTFRVALARQIEAGLPVHAECAGLMYLCRSLTVDDIGWEMVGALAGDVSLHQRPVGRGYVRLQPDLDRATSMGLSWPSAARQHEPAVVPAHEFHHSTIAFDVAPECLYRVARGHGLDGAYDGVCKHNVIASYAHFRHTAATPWIDAFLERVKKARQCESRKSSSYAAALSPNATTGIRSCSR